MRGFFHKTDPRKEKDRGKKAAWCPSLAAQWNAEGRGLYAVINDGGDTDISIRCALATFGEWDNTNREQQANFDWNGIGLPRPTMAVWSSYAPDASLHFYWCYTTPVTDLWRWRLLQWRIIQLLNSDSSIENFSRVMRVPGFEYPGKGLSYIDYTISTGQRIDFYELESLVWQAEQARGVSYLTAIPKSKEVRDNVKIYLGIDLSTPKPEHSAPTPTAAPQKPSEKVEAEYEQDTIEDIKEALRCIPPRGAVPGTYKERDRNILWGLAAALESIGRDRQEAVALVEQAGWQDWDPAQVLATGGSSIDASTFWFHAQQAGYRSKRKRLPPKAETPQQKKEQRESIEQRLAAVIDCPKSEVSLLIADLSKEVGIHSVELHKIFDDLVKRDTYSHQLKSEEENLQKKLESRKLSKLITLEYLFPAKLAEALKVRTQYLPCDPLSISIPYITGQSALLPLGSRLKAASVSGFEVPLNLYSVLVAQSGGKKSPLKTAVVSEPIEELHKEAMQKNDIQMQNWKHENDGVKEKDKNPKPAAMFIKVSNVTPEVLAQQLSFQEKWKRGLLLLRDEFSGLIGSIDQYKSGGKGDGMQQFLELFDGDGTIALFKTIDNVQFESSHLSIFCNGQRHLIKEYIQKGDSKGLWARFAMAPLPGIVVPLPPEDTEEAEQEIERARQTLREISRAMFMMPIRVLRFSREARAAFSRYEEKQARLALASDDVISSLYGKSAAKVARISGILHCLDLACGENVQPFHVPLPTLDRACNLVDHMNSWMLSLVIDAKGEGVIDRILSIAKRLGKPVSKRDITISLGKSERETIDSQMILQSFASLERLGLGRIDDEGRFEAFED